MDDEIKKEEAAQSGAPSGAGDEERKEELEKCRAERDEYLAGWQRAKADLVNYKRDEFQRLNDAVAYAAEDAMREMVSILDSFDLGLSALQRLGPVDRGIYILRAQVEDILAKKGLTRIPVETGKPCDHRFVESVAEVESDLPAGTVVAEIEPGYALNGKVVRPARVTVAKGKPAGGGGRKELNKNSVEP